MMCVCVCDMRYAICDIRCARLFQYPLVAFAFYFERIPKTTQHLDIVLSFDNIQHLCGSSFIVGFCYLCWSNRWHTTHDTIHCNVVVFWKHFWFYEIFRRIPNELFPFLALWILRICIFDTFKLSSFISGVSIQISRIQFRLTLFCVFFLRLFSSLSSSLLLSSIQT